MQAYSIYISAISIHAPREGGRRGIQYHAIDLAIHDFNPRPPRGGRRCPSSRRAPTSTFQSTPPTRGGDEQGVIIRRCGNDFNPRPPRGGRPQRRGSAPQPAAISIHAPHEGGDPISFAKILDGEYFNPRPPRGGRLSPPRDCSRDAEFQSTPPTRGATRCRLVRRLSGQFQSTPPTRGATRHGDHRRDGAGISIHAPHEGGDRGSRPLW